MSNDNYVNNIDIVAELSRMLIDGAELFKLAKKRYYRTVIFGEFVYWFIRWNPLDKLKKLTVE